MLREETVPSPRAARGSLCFRAVHETLDSVKKCRRRSGRGRKRAGRRAADATMMLTGAGSRRNLKSDQNQSQSQIHAPSWGHYRQLMCFARVRLRCPLPFYTRHKSCPGVAVVPGYEAAAGEGLAKRRTRGDTTLITTSGRASCGTPSRDRIH